jgi:hypothetical protein
MLRDEQRLRVFEDKLLRRISGPKRDEVTGGYITLHEGLQNLNSPPDIIGMTRSSEM